MSRAGVTPTPTTTYTYTYSDENWGDQLTAYRGVEFEYDAIGNPLTYYNGKSYEFTWTQGRRLASADAGWYDLMFEYNADGIRTSKTVNGVEYKYTLDGTKILTQEWGNQMLIFLYDEAGSPVGFQYRNSTYAYDQFDTYWYRKNLQGDVMAIYDADGTTIAWYAYDAFGKQTYGAWRTHANNLYKNIYNLNPYRYRSYYYDTETSLYYLNSRYYDPATCRFINADSFISTGQGILGNNMYAYCGNNPVMRVDPTGEWFLAAIFVVAVVTIVTTLSSCSQPAPTHDVGAAGPYVPSKSTEYNCYAHAMGETDWKYVGGSPEAVNDFDVDSVAEMVLLDAQRDGRNIRIIESYDSPIADNEYRIALRTGAEDYHFMVQHADGTWSHKPGSLPTRLLNGKNPSVVSWDAPTINLFIWYQFGILKEDGYKPNYYDSKTVYFAVST